MIAGHQPHFQAPATMTPEQLGDHLARLVWESFSDFMTDPAIAALLHRLGLMDEDANPVGRVDEEALIFLLWAHTRGVQQAYRDRGTGDLAKAALDALHRAVFEDLVTNGMNRSELPLFEQRVSARYARYGHASNVSDGSVGSAVVAFLTGERDAGNEGALELASWAISVTEPLSDFYTEVDLVEA
ncbi:MAG: hypothetical protein HKO53_04235 [Gemmatimonadetes bacterium]|nr:hypothetical protein [Gemmatimonadota bacterium]NNM32244.1 hypothetical protein [Gemmatimonadota bacterium]